MSGAGKYPSEKNYISSHNYGSEKSNTTYTFGKPKIIRVSHQLRPGQSISNQPQNYHKIVKQSSNGSSGHVKLNSRIDVRPSTEATNIGFQKRSNTVYSKQNMRKFLILLFGD